MTMQRFQSLVLKLGNQMFVRHYCWLNYPQDPPLLGLEFKNGVALTRLGTELRDLGFSLRKDGIWAIERTEETSAAKESGSCQQQSPSS